MMNWKIARLLVIASIPALAQQPPCLSPPLVITKAAIVDGNRLEPNREMIVEGGRVVALGRAGKLKRPPGARVIDATGDTLLRGLMDAHAHMNELGGPSPPEMYEAPRENAFPVTGRQLLRSGVTTARVHLFDLVHGPALKRDAESDCFPSPRLQIGGPGITGGQPQMSGSNFTGYKSLDDARAKPDAMTKAGVDWVALHGLNRFPPNELEQIAVEIRKRGIRIMAEGDPVERAEIALDIGADSIEYLDRSAAGYSEPFLARLKRSQTYLVPPIGYFNRVVAVRQPGVVPVPLWFSFMPKPVAAQMRDRWLTWIAQPDRAVGIIDQLNQRFQQLVRAGVKIAVGTDCGSPANFQVDAIWWELETHRRLGVSAIQAVDAATTATAVLLRLDDTGRLTNGARADFVLYRGDLRSGPLQVDRVRTVAKGGVLYVDEGAWTGR